MNTDTGQIFNPEEVARLLGDSTPTKAKSQLAKLIEMKIPPTEEQMRKNPPKVSRNDSCPCGSGFKFKHCHWTGDDREQV